ncbi:MAG: ESPR-type extended signal peptide-containing protein [Veillonella sp.]|uniref:ESPR-type extended signal peptide-containing protein n=1 Tax=Veillonella sp. TaxID=1926307 RepID=UPI0028FDCF27|nr:ESPR-type extended signal peptide-containing protein [Veillonella sp.]MDU2712070.1 ESPR-type extended signal peptide-containing protein [Veillonella sp.]
MNKIFKVVWSKSKECYVVVSEVAKNNGGKKKALASVLAGLAIMGAAAQMGTPVQAGADNRGSAVNLWADKQLDGTTPNTANTVGANSVAIGNNLVAGSASTTPTGRLGGTAIAIGVDSQAKDDRDIAIGYNNTTEGQDSVAMGSNVIAGTGQSIAIGSTNTAPDGTQTQTIARGKVTMKNGRPEPAAAIAIGVGAQALDGSGVLAMGQLSYAKGNNDVAIGTQTKVIGNNSTAIGSTAQAIGNSSAAFGTQAVANGLGATAVGPGASAGTGDTTATAAAGATAVGRAAQATKEGASALGWAANASVENAAAIGRDTTANIAGGVALGYQSVTTTAAGVQGYNPASDRTDKYSTQAGAVGTSTLAAVSIGEGVTKTRQLTGLAAGTEDTDAVNVAQLKNVNLKYAGDTGNSDVLLKDHTLNINGDTDTFISTSADANGVKITAKVAKNITANADGKAVAPTTNGIATTDNVTQAINNSGWKVTSANNGGTTNGSSSEKVSPGDTVTFSAGKNIVLDQAGKQFTYSLSSTLKDIESIQNGASKITLNNGGGTTISGGNLSVDGNKITNVAPGTDDTDAVNYKQLKAAKTVVKGGTNVTVDKGTGANGEDIYTVNATAGGTASTESVVKKAAAAGDTNIADVSVAGGKNVNDPGAQYEVSVSKNAVKDAAREAVTVNNGGNTDNPITVTPTDDAANHNTTYAVTFDGDKAAKQIPLTYKANGSGDKTVKLDKGLDFTNGTNTTAEIGNDGVVKFNLKDNVALTNAGSLTVGDTKVNNDGLTISGGPSVTKNGIDAGNQKITNVAPGTISSTSTDAVNGSQLYDVDQKFNNTVKLTGNAGATDGQALNKANGLSFGVIGANSGAYIKTSATGSDVTVDLSDDAKTKLNKTYTVSSGSSNVTVTPTTVGDNTDYKISVTGGAAALILKQ